MRFPGSDNYEVLAINCGVQHEENFWGEFPP